MSWFAAIHQESSTQGGDSLNAASQRQQRQRIDMRYSGGLHDREVIEQERRADGIGQEAGGTQQPKHARAKRLLSRKRRLRPWIFLCRRKPGVRAETKFLRTIPEQQGGDRQNGQRDQSGKGKIGASPAEQRNEEIDQLRKNH